MLTPKAKQELQVSLKLFTINCFSSLLREEQCRISGYAYECVCVADLTSLTIGDEQSVTGPGGSVV